MPQGCGILCAVALPCCKRDLCGVNVTDVKLDLRSRSLRDNIEHRMRFRGTLACAVTDMGFQIYDAGLKDRKLQSCTNEWPPLVLNKKRTESVQLNTWSVHLRWCYSNENEQPLSVGVHSAITSSQWAVQMGLERFFPTGRWRNCHQPNDPSLRALLPALWNHAQDY